LFSAWPTVSSLCHAIKARTQHPRQGLRGCAHWRHPDNDQPWLSRAARCLCHAAHAAASSSAGCDWRPRASSPPSMRASAAPGAAAPPSAAAADQPCQPASRPHSWRCQPSPLQSWRCEPSWPCQPVSASGSVTVARRQTIGTDVLKSIHIGASRAPGSGCAAWGSRAPHAFLSDGQKAAAFQALREIGFPTAARDAALPLQSPSCLRAWSSGDVRKRVHVAVHVGHECLVEQGPRGLEDATVEQVTRDAVPTTARPARTG
jgi:hypothetical protein